MLYDWKTQTYTRVNFSQLSDKEQNRILKEALCKENKEAYLAIEKIQNYEGVGFSQLSDKEQNKLLREELYKTEKEYYSNKLETKTYKNINKTIKKHFEYLKNNQYQIKGQINTMIEIQKQCETINDEKQKELFENILFLINDLIQETLENYYSTYEYLTRKEIDEDSGEYLRKEGVGLEIEIENNIEEVEKNIRNKIEEIKSELIKYKKENSK